MKGTLMLLGIFAAGTLWGWFVPDQMPADSFDPAQFALYALMIFVGIGVGSDTKSFSALKEYRWRIFMVPLTVVVGSLVGAAAVWPLIGDFSLKDTLAVGAGFGYYSLSSIYITEVSGPAAGVTALMANIFREILTLVAAPMLAKIAGALAPIACGGATSMDTTLPVITRSVGREYAVISVFSGIVLTVLVPLLVPAILALPL